jgi:hypothetical protein
MQNKKDDKILILRLRFILFLSLSAIVHDFTHENGDIIIVISNYNY